MGQIRKRASQVHTVNVGGNGNFFDPDTIYASVGDIISFQFYPTNHTVVRAEYKFPCIPYEDTGAGKVGFFSGFHPVTTIMTNPPTWNLTVNDTHPVFYYCTAPGSCIQNQMVGAINPNSSMKLDVQKDFASKASYMLLPGQPFPNEGSPTSMQSASSAIPTSTPSPSTSSSPSPSSSPASPAPASASEQAPATQSALSPGAIAGIAIAGAAAILILLCVRRFFRVFLAHYRRSRQPGQSPRDEGPTKMPRESAFTLPTDRPPSSEMRDRSLLYPDSSPHQGYLSGVTRVTASPPPFRESTFGKPMGLQIHEIPTTDVEHPPQELAGGETHEFYR